MTKTRKAKKAITNVSANEATEAASSYVKNAHRIETIELKMNERIQKIRDEFQDELNELNDAQEQHVEMLNVFANEQSASWPNKSIDINGCVIGFRTNPPSVTKTGKATWEYLVDQLLKNKVLKAFVRVKNELDKKAILGNKDAKVTKQLESIGIVVESSETFYVDVKKETV